MAFTKGVLPAESSMGGLVTESANLQYLFILDPHTQSDRFLLWYEDSKVGNLAALQPSHRLLDALLRHGKRLNDRLDLVLRGKF